MKRKVIVMLTTLTMCLGLTGCMGEIADIKINNDGSGTVKLSAGISENAIEMLSSMEGEGSEADTSDMVPFIHNGITYYGETESVEFNSIEELNELMGELSTTEEDGVDTGAIQVNKNTDGTIELVLTANSNTGDTDAMKESIGESTSEIDEATMEMLMQDMAIVFDFTFPDKVKQVSGPSEGVTINENKLTLDFIEMGKSVDNTVEYRFTTSDKEIVPEVRPEIKPEAVKVKFSDVPETMWCYKAVMSMAEKGLVSGIGNGKFDPNETLTYAQFCSIVARDCSLKTGEMDGYWAGKAIQSCITEGFIKDLGEITRENYDKPITREAAVSAMYLIDRGENGVVREVSTSDIPDFESISDDYKENIVNAYRAGITSGMDGSGTFNPMGELTRGQICTLFYNLNK